MSQFALARTLAAEDAWEAPLRGTVHAGRWDETIALDTVIDPPHMGLTSAWHSSLGAFADLYTVFVRTEGLTYEIPPPPAPRVTADSVGDRAAAALQDLPGVEVRGARWREDGIWIRCGFNYTPGLEDEIQSRLDALEEELAGEALVYLDAEYLVDEGG